MATIPPVPEGWVPEPPFSIPDTISELRSICGISSDTSMCEVTDVTVRLSNSKQFWMIWDQRQVVRAKMKHVVGLIFHGTYSMEIITHDHNWNKDFVNHKITESQYKDVLSYMRKNIQTK